MRLKFPKVRHVHLGTVIGETHCYKLWICRCQAIKTSFTASGGYSPKPTQWPYVRLGWVSQERWEEIQDTTTEFDPGDPYGHRHF